MKSSCVQHPANERLVIIRKWQVEFCEGNQCAAALLSYFEYWHSWKLNTDRYNHKSNDIAEFHGEARSLNENVMQYHSLTEMSDGILNLYGEKAISQAIKLLESKSVISIHGNPNPRFHYDKTKYFRFYPEVCNEWIDLVYKSRSSKSTVSKEQKDACNTVKMRDASSQNTLPCGKNTVLITEINNKEINNLNKPGDELLDEENQLSSLEINNETQQIINLLINKGMPAERIIDNPDFSMLSNLINRGATASIVSNAYDLSVKATSDRGKQFGLRYLTKVIEDLLRKSVKSEVNVNRIKKPIEQTYENDFSGGLDWMGDLVGK